jgi:protein-S-isoprenylcysteine O-methyltransferase
MGNVLCFFAYAAVLWMFFSKRIKHEEAKLIEFFQDDYVQYRKRVGTKIPFIA